MIKTEIDVEKIAAYLLRQGVLYLSTAKDPESEEECIGLYILINDYFAPASDAEYVTRDELPTLYKLYKQRKHDGVAQFVADKRGIPNIYWRKKVEQSY